MPGVLVLAMGALQYAGYDLASAAVMARIVLSAAYMGIKGKNLSPCKSVIVFIRIVAVNYIIDLLS